MILAASPWISGFAALVYVPHLVLGLVEIAVASATRTVPYETGPRRLRRRHAVEAVL